MGEDISIQLGRRLDDSLLDSGDPLEVPLGVFLEPSIVLGAPGSGKTTLGLHLFAELQRNGVAVLVIDTTGETTSTLESWEGARTTKGFADETNPVDPRFQLNVLDLDSIADMFHRPLVGRAGDDVWLEHGRHLVFGLLELLGYRVRVNVTTPEVALLESIVDWLWGEGRDVSLTELGALIAEPPIRKLGAFGLDEVISPQRRSELSAAIQSVVDASNAIAKERARIDFHSLLTQSGGEPAVNIISFDHASVEVQRFLSVVVLSHAMTYVKRRETSPMPVVFYIDDARVLAPTESGHASTELVLEILDQAEALDAAITLVTGEPANINDRALGRIQTWCAGRFPAARARQEVVAEFDLVNPPVDEDQLDDALSRMSAGQFVLRSPHLSQLEYFHSPAPR